MPLYEYRCEEDGELITLLRPMAEAECERVISQRSKHDVPRRTRASSVHSAHHRTQRRPGVFRLLRHTCVLRGGRCGCDEGDDPNSALSLMALKIVQRPS